MTRSSKRLLRAGGLAVVILGALAAAASSQVPPRLVQPRPAPKPLPCNGPDLALTPPDVRLETYNGEMWCVAHAQVLNKGTMDYAGRLDQAVMFLTFKKLWDPSHPSVIRTPIGSLAKGGAKNAGGSCRLDGYKATGCASPLKPGECCREMQVTLQIVFDPDIRADGNPANDDCNASNNAWPDVPQTHVKFTVPCVKVVKPVR